MNPASLPAMLHSAQNLYNAGRNLDSWRTIAPARELLTNNGPALRIFARIAMGAGEIDAAVEALKRAAQIEDDPADVIGGLADLLGTVGHTEEAIHYWSLLAAKYPQLADAHLNLAVTAFNASRFDLALQSSTTGLERFPGHARLLAIQAMALGNLGRIEESLKVFDKAIGADPNRALTRYNQAMALRGATRFAEACEAFATAARLGLRGAQFHASWAGAALQDGNADEAARLYEIALREEPGHLDSLKALTAIEFEFRGGDEAFRHFEQSVKARNGSPDAWLDWIGELSANYRFDEAARVGDRALAMHPDQPPLLFLTTIARGMSGDAALALAELARLPEQLRESNAGLLGGAQLALRSGDAELAAKLAEAAAGRDPTTQIGWALLSLAWRLLGDPREQWLCDYDRLVMVTEVPSANGEGAAEYAAEMADVLQPLHKSNASPGNQSLRNGTQTRGQLFANPDPAIQHFRDAVVLAARDAIDRLPEDPGHPFLARKSRNLGFSGSWSVHLQAGDGHHVPHFHNLGWMSSAYYARLPEADPQMAGRHEGWIEFGRPPERFDLALPPRRLVEPRPGRLVLFPSYLWHGTVPFTQGSRLTAAFDYQPLP